jgi:hypothetical protein
MSTGICVECGNDDACEGWPCCSDCLQELYSDAGADARLAELTRGTHRG